MWESRLFGMPSYLNTTVIVNPNQRLEFVHYRSLGQVASLHTPYPGR